MLERSYSGVDSKAACTAVAHDLSLKTLFGVETSLAYHPEIIALLNRAKELASILAFNVSLISPLFSILQSVSDVLYGKLLKLRKLVLDEIDNQLKSNQQPHQELPFSTYMVLRNRRDNEGEQKIFRHVHEVFVTAGHTVASKLSNTICFLAVLPDIQERAWQEQYEIFGNDIRDPTIEELSQMKFLDRFLKESFRFLGPPFLGKEATADINVDGITIPRGAIVVYLLRYIKLHPKYWNNPNIFDPDRFLDENDYLKFSYSPFGIGIRNCPGEYYGTIFLKIALSKMLRRIKFRPVEKDFRFEDIKFKSYLFLEVDNPPKLQIEKRT
ncbi:unnamed protein product [Nezara viridula]|uniref:Cytochrome P450 n=1 Tax=Nezara viridula TaxID=85310 RepID=A0A9P0EDR6_NEZVI|nr:unnamed protein product [Nezara viridula]